MTTQLNRRDFLRLSALTAAGIAATACAKTATEAPVEPTQPAAAPTATQAAAAPTATPEPAGPSEQQAPMLIDMIRSGDLPSLEDRLTTNPLVLTPVQEVGEYGGTWRHADLGMGMSGRQNLTSLFFWNRDATAVIPDLAATVEILEEGKVYSFGLREGQKWSDGEPFTADDMVWLYENVWMNEDLSPNGPSGWLRAGGEPVTVEKMDDYTLHFRFAEPYGLFMLYMAFSGEGILDTPPQFMEQFHATFAEKAALDQVMADLSLDTWDKVFWNKNSWTQNVDKPSLRPWKLVREYEAAATFYDIERNAYYHKVDPDGNQLPYIDVQRWKRVETAELVPLSALAGEIDFQLRRIVLKDYPVLADGAEKGDYRLILWENMNTGMVVFPNHTLLGDDEVLALNQDVRWRKALSMLVDRDEMNELVYLGMAGPVQGCFPESFASESELWEPFDHNPDMANELLDELGLDKRDNQGWRLLPSGKKLQLTFEGYAPDTDVMAAGELFVAGLQEAGIDAAVEGVTNDLWWNRIYSSEYQAAVYLKNNSGALIQPVYARAYTPVQHSCYWAPEWGNWYETQGKAGAEPTGMPRELQKLYDQVGKTIDQDKRVEIFEEIYHMYLEFFPDIICVGRAPDPGVVKNNFMNVPDKCYQAWTLKTPALANPEQFFFKS